MKNFFFIELSIIVFVEDDEDILVVLLDVFVDEGLVCCLFVRLEDVLEYILEGGDCFVLVIDIKMLKMFGFQFVLKFWDLLNLMSEIFVIIVFGNVIKKEVQEVLCFSVSEFLDKLIQFDYFVDLFC